MAIDERAWPAPTAWVRWILIVASAALLGCSGGGSGGGSGTPGITRSLTNTTLSLSEGGAAQTFSFALNSAPTAGGGGAGAAGGGGGAAPAAGAGGAAN